MATLGLSVSEAEELSDEDPWDIPIPTSPDEERCLLQIEEVSPAADDAQPPPPSG